MSIRLSCPNDKNCISCNTSTSQCLKCSFTYRDPRDGECKFPSGPSIQNCLEYLPISGTEAKESLCGVCIPGHFPSMLRGSCLLCPTRHCALCDSENPAVCRACFRGMAVVGNRCVSLADEALANCSIQINGTCLDCKPGFSSKNGACESENPQGCLVVDPVDPLTCLECRVGTSVGPKGDCEGHPIFFTDPWNEESDQFALGSLVGILVWLALCLTGLFVCFRPKYRERYRQPL